MVCSLRLSRPLNPHGICSSARHGDIQTLRLEKEFGEIGGECGIRGGERKDNHVALLTLEALHRINYDLPTEGVVGQCVLHEPPNLACLRSVGSDYPDLIAGDARREQLIHKIHDHTGFSAAMGGAVVML